MIGYDDREHDGHIGLWPFVLWFVVPILLWTLIVCGITSAFAQESQPSECSGTATSTAAAIVFPTSGQTGPAFPSQYLTIANPSATATLWVCAAKGCTATANTAGSIALSPAGGAGQNGISWWKGAFPPPLVVSILSSAATSPFTCNYQ